ncbi:MAG: exonuclease SbcCD subunit D [Pyrinomonadaceae bacterium]
MKFLHIADIHLGCDRYHLKESQKDFFDAWLDVLRKYAVDENVDFVIMCGDFFHKRNVQPESMNYAFAGLNLLKKNGIPVVSIEGNHDQHYIDSRHSWLRSLAAWNLLYLLEPSTENGETKYKPWNNNKNRGGYIDIGNARIFGSSWYGSQSNLMIPKLIDSIEDNKREGAFHILLLHTDVEGHQTHPIPALTVENLIKLKSAVDYVGLGHTHKCYEIDNWAFNPGSLEITNIAEYQEIRGAWLIEVDEDFKVNAKHVQNYVQRPFQRIGFDVDKFDDPKTLTSELLKHIKEMFKFGDKNTERAPVVEVTLRGRLGFPNSSLELNKVRKKASELTSALHIILKNHTLPLEFGEDIGAREQSREIIERNVIEHFVSQDKRFNKNKAKVAEAIIETKHLVISGEPPEKIADFIATSVVQHDQAEPKT